VKTIDKAGGGGATEGMLPTNPMILKNAHSSISWMSSFID